MSVGEKVEVRNKDGWDEETRAEQKNMIIKCKGKSGVHELTLDELLVHVLEPLVEVRLGL